MKPLTNAQKTWIVDRVGQWLVVSGHDTNGDAEASHSSLLWRLLSGEEPLPDPPPTYFRRPDYELAEGRPTLCEISCHGDTLVVNQDGRWERLTVCLLRFKPSRQVYRALTAGHDFLPDGNGWTRAAVLVRVNVNEEEMQNAEYRTGDVEGADEGTVATAGGDAATGGDNRDAGA